MATNLYIHDRRQPTNDYHLNYNKIYKISATLLFTTKKKPTRCQNQTTQKNWKKKVFYSHGEVLDFGWQMMMLMCSFFYFCFFARLVIFVYKFYTQKEERKPRRKNFFHGLPDKMFHVFYSIMNRKLMKFIFFIIFNT